MEKRFCVRSAKSLVVFREFYGTMYRQGGVINSNMNDFNVHEYVCSVNSFHGTKVNPTKAMVVNKICALANNLCELNDSLEVYYNEKHDTEFQDFMIVIHSKAVSILNNNDECKLLGEIISLSDSVHISKFNNMIVYRMYVHGYWE